MAGELDDVCAQVDCPKCGAILNVPFSQIRLQNVRCDDPSWGRHSDRGHSTPDRRGEPANVGQWCL